MAAEEGNQYAVGNSGGGAPEGNQNAVGNSGGGAPKGNQNAAEHGVYTDPANLLDTLDSPALAWVDRKYRDYLELVPFDESDPRAERLKILCVMMYQEHVARALIQEETDGTLAVTRTVVDDSGREYDRREPHHLLAAASQLSRDIRAGLDAFGLLGRR